MNNILKNKKTFTKFIRTYALLPISILVLSVCLLLTTGHVHAVSYVSGSYSAGDYSDSSYNQGSSASNVNNPVSTSNPVGSTSSDSSNDNTDGSSESATTTTNPTTSTTKNDTNDQTKDQKSPINISATTPGVIIAIGAVVLILIMITVLLLVKKYRTK